MSWSDLTVSIQLSLFSFGLIIERLRKMQCSDTLRPQHMQIDILKNRRFKSTSTRRPVKTGNCTSVIIGSGSSLHHHFLGPQRSSTLLKWIAWIEDSWNEINGFSIARLERTTLIWVSYLWDIAKLDRTIVPLNYSCGSDWRILRYNSLIESNTTLWLSSSQRFVWKIRN